ncbi:copper homeostasis periplasmic binding protein CopC [Neorhizobium sp. NCHU2750]|uniref:copper homeostasis periplasmic binding protein CopC n=1 Tax=Neorhizobium sp. NCHU2750 TaxID=1825976 RepID=UPI000E732988|nr:copper resistance protein C [Neorhizobium sp. NCHU2750]
MFRSIKITLFALTAAAAVSSQAFAHAHLKTSNPADKASVTSPSELDLTFTEGLNLKFSGITVTDGDGKTVGLGESKLSEGDKTLVVPVSAPLSQGTYKVEWHVLSTDGHKTNGAYSFTVKP